VWDGGFIVGEIGALDFADGDIVHISSGTIGLILAILLGKRVGYAQTYTAYIVSPLFS
jgi:Amt family ammonium transporter